MKNLWNLAKKMGKKTKYLFESWNKFFKNFESFKSFKKNKNLRVLDYLWEPFFNLITVMLWSHMTSYVMDLTWSGQFQIITDPASRGWLSHQSLDYLIFQINLPTFGSTFRINLLNQPFESIYAINLFIKLAAPLACGILLPLTNVRT